MKNGSQVETRSWRRCKRSAASFSNCFFASGVDEKGRISEILRIAAMRGIPVERVTRDRIDRMGENPQGVALEASEFPYVDLTDILDYAETTDEDLFVLVLDLIQNPQTWVPCCGLQKRWECMGWCSRNTAQLELLQPS